MAHDVSDDLDGLGGSLAMYAVALIAAAAVLALPIYLMSPDTHLANPGMAAYKPPPGARVLPLARKMDAPPIVTYADREDAELEASRAMAQADAEPQPKPVAKPVLRARQDDEPAVRYTQRNPFDLFGIFN